MAEKQCFMTDDRQVTPVACEPSGLATEFQKHLADAAQSVAEQMHSTGYAARGTQLALAEVGVSVSPGDSADIRNIPTMHEVARNTRLEPGDVVIVGRSDHGPHGNSFTVTNDMRAASDHLASIPSLDKLPEVHIYRTNDKT